jgi:hypothetical protein
VLSVNKTLTVVVTATVVMVVGAVMLFLTSTQSGNLGRTSQEVSEEGSCRLETQEACEGEISVSDVSTPCLDDYSERSSTTCGNTLSANPEAICNSRTTTDPSDCSF